MAAPENLDEILKLEEGREQLALEMEQASALESRHRANEKAIGHVGSNDESAFVCLSKHSFIKLPVECVRKVLETENSKVWAEVEQTQRRITKLAREVEEKEAELKARQSSQ